MPRYPTRSSSRSWDRSAPCGPIPSWPAASISGAAASSILPSQRPSAKRRYPSATSAEPPRSLCFAERVHRGHQGGRPPEEIRHLDRFLDLPFGGAHGARPVGDVRHAVRVRQERVHDHGHEDLVLGGDGAVLQDVLALAHVRFHELGIALLQLLNPRGQGRLSHVCLLELGSGLTILHFLTNLLGDYRGKAS